MTGTSDEQSPGTERTRLDPAGEFFSVGTPLHAVRAGYVRRAADDVLYETLVAGRYAHVLAPERTGKSSLVAATAARLENHGFKVAILDLEQIVDRDAGTDAGRWYYSVAYRLLRQLRIRADLQSWWQDKSILSNQQRLVEFYSELILQNVQERVVIFVDEIQCAETLEFADQLFGSIRASHSARATNPEFTRLTFALLGECDPVSVVDEPELSPFTVTQPIVLGDFSRPDIDLFANELNLNTQDAAAALDRIYHWTAGQPYLTQKLARAVAREQIVGDVAGNVDRIVMHQLANRAALRNEPHMSHIHRAVVNDVKRCEGLLTLYGKLRKGVHVASDMGSPLQRRLIAIGLLKIDEDGGLVVRNRLYEAVFTVRWANENLPLRWRTPVIAAGIFLLILAVPLWYTQLLPKGYIEILASDSVELPVAEEAYRNMRSFPGHADSADSLYRSFILRRAGGSMDEEQVRRLAAMAADLPNTGRLSDQLLAAYWDRRAREARRDERRDDALLATLKSLVLSTPQRRARAAELLGRDYPLLLASLRRDGIGDVVFDAGNMTLTDVRDARVSQWTLEPQGLRPRQAWSMTALEVTPLVRRIIVDRNGEVRRANLTINLSHARARDLRIKIIAPSGRAVEVDPGVERASSNQDLRIPASQLGGLIGEPLNGTWSISVRDEELGVAGQLVGWNLSLNSQGLVEDFQRGLNIADPVERETDNLWFSADGRYAVARAMQSDSARVWDLAFARPVRAVAVNELERVIGVSAGARLLVTSTQDTVHLWETSSGNRVASLPVSTGSPDALLTDDGVHLFVQRRSDVDTTLELWSLDNGEAVAALQVAGTPALVSLDASGRRVAVADFDRAVRVWDMVEGTLVAQIDLPAQPSEIRLGSGGEVLAAVFREAGAGLWRVDRPQRPLLESFAPGRWQVAFSPSGSRVLVGRSGEGFRVHDTRDGRWLGPLLGSGGPRDAGNLLAFSADEQIIVTGGPGSVARFWRAPALPPQNAITEDTPRPLAWPPSGDAVAIVTPDAATMALGTPEGDVAIRPLDAGPAQSADDVGRIDFLGHTSEVTLLAASPDSALIASAASDNSVRVWDAPEQLPRRYFIDVPGEPVSRMEFSPDGSRLAILNGSVARLIDTATGHVLARFELGEAHSGIAFADVDHVYLGSDSGALRVIEKGADADWALRDLWQGGAGIRWLEASPHGTFLVLVDADDVALQFSLTKGDVGSDVLQLPGPVEDVSFVPGGTRVLFRTTRWLHRASSSESGLTWDHAVLVPKPLAGASMVFGDPREDAAVLWGARLFLPMAGDDFLRLQEVDFSAASGTGLFGNREQLLQEWQTRLGLALVAPESSDQ
jgi:WD40 repeat protein